MFGAIVDEALAELFDLVVALRIVAVVVAVDARLRVGVTDVVETVETQEDRVVLRLALGVRHEILLVLASALAVDGVVRIGFAIRSLDLFAHQPAIRTTAEQSERR
jgi:hypothetical protein